MTYDTREANVKVLSVRQPFADLIVRGIKEIENRTWQTPYRGLAKLNDYAARNGGSGQCSCNYRTAVPISSSLDIKLDSAARGRPKGLGLNAHISKVEKMVALHERTKEEEEERLEPADQPPKDDRDKFPRFDPSSGDRAQKSPQHPMGDALVPDGASRAPTGRAGGVC